MTPSTGSAPLPFAEQIVVFSGRLSSLSRKQAQALVQQLGGVCMDDVTSRTTILVVGADGPAPGGRIRDAAALEEADQHPKVRKAEQVNARQPGRVAVISENEFCRRAGLPAPGHLSQQFYGVRDIRGMYPAINEQHLRYLAKWGLIQPVVRTNTETYYSFQDLLVVKQASAELERGAGFRSLLRGLVSARAGQLAFDFRPMRADAQPAKVVALERRPPLTIPSRSPATAPSSAPQRTLAARYFLEGSALDDGDVTKQEAAMAAYRHALSLDPALVPAIVNLANIHYARDEAIEAQALYERAMNIDPECFEAHFNLGNIFHDLSQYAEAHACYQDAIALNPTYADAHFYLAVTLEKMGRSGEAKPHWRAYQELAPDGEWVELAKEFSE